MQAEHLDVADLVFEAVGGALRLRRSNERNRPLQSENECCPRAAEDQIATRNLEHFLSPWVDPARRGSRVAESAHRCSTPGCAGYSAGIFGHETGTLPQG